MFKQSRRTNVVEEKLAAQCDRTFINSLGQHLRIINYINNLCKCAHIHRGINICFRRSEAPRRPTPRGHQNCRWIIHVAGLRSPMCLTNFRFWGLLWLCNKAPYVPPFESNCSTIIHEWTFKLIYSVT